MRAASRTPASVASESDANSIRLPATLPVQKGGIPTLEQYRLIAVQHAERIRRETARHGQFATTDLERDLYQIAEAAAIDAYITENQPGLRASLQSARATAMAARPHIRRQTEIEQRVEAILQRSFSSDDTALNINTPPLPLANDAPSNAEWARETARTLEAMHGSDSAVRKYRRVREVTMWSIAIRTNLTDEQTLAHSSAGESQSTEASKPTNNERNRDDGSKPVASETEADNAAQPTDENEGASSPDSDGAGDPDSPADDEAKGQPTPGPEASENEERAPDQPSAGANTQTTDAAAPQAANVASDAATPGGITFEYPEWNFHVQNFNEAGTTVRVMPSEPGSPTWAKSVLQENAREVHRARQQFERLRSHRTRLRRQVQGDELDLEACVDAIVDRRMHVAPTDRLYRLERPGRRDLAITLLIDVSGSTREVVSGDQRVIDIERIAAAVATAAFDALGDDYSILAFSSAGAANVTVHTVKSFGEKNTSVVLQRIGALAPDGNTRLGSAVRHATAMLNKHPAPHRLLLIISDGKPYDYDFYFIDYAIQDSRHAVMAARQAGIQPFCITVDASEGASYLPDIFGATGYRVVSKPSQLSQALLLAVQRMIGGNG